MDVRMNANTFIFSAYLNPTKKEIQWKFLVTLKVTRMMRTEKEMVT